jgi:hypothetical protein
MKKTGKIILIIAAILSTIGIGASLLVRHDWEAATFLP